MLFNLLVEGHVDEAVARRLLRHCGHDAGVTYGGKGWKYVEQKVAAFDRSCSGQGLFTLVDFMDTGKRCPTEVLRHWLPQRAATHVFRVVVREIESWILADRPAIARLLSLPLAKIPLAPEELDDPKQTLIQLARGSRLKTIRETLVPIAGYAASEGPLYAAEIARFVGEKWNPDTARRQSASLDKCILRLNQLHT